MIKITDDGKVLYRASHPDCTRYPMLGMELSLLPGMSRNYQVFDPLDFLASVTQHIPNKGISAAIRFTISNTDFLGADQNYLKTPLPDCVFSAAVL